MIRTFYHKQTDPNKLPGQIINRPVNFEKPLVKEVEDWMGVPVKERVLEAIGKSRGDYIHLIYNLWQEDVISEEVYVREIQKDKERKLDKYF